MSVLSDSLYKHGLLTQEGQKVPLKEIKIDIQILGFIAEVSSTLLYTNKEDSPVEAEFTFPVDDGSAVFKFEAEIEGRRIVAEIQEKEQAKLTYQDAIEKGSTALLLKEDDKAGDIFQCILGNLPAKTDAKIVFSYVIELPQEPDGKVRFTLPTVLNPRYSPAVGGTVAAEGATYSAPENIPYKFDMAAIVRSYYGVLSVTSASDKLRVDTNEDKSTSVTLNEEFKFDHDLSFLVEYKNRYSPQVIFEKGVPDADGILKEDMLMINFFPELHETSMTTTGEYIFVIDRSGSMYGNRIKNAKEALFLFLKSLPTDCFFNIVSFGSSYSFLFEGNSKKYTESNLNAALTLQNEMKADMGGTEIYQPFKEIFSTNPIKGHPRQIILLTDGEVRNTDQLIGLVKSHAHNTRVFPLGIGSGVSTSLIKGVARAGNGKAEFITDDDRIQPKVVSLLKCATLPVVSNLELVWDLPSDITVLSIPQQLPTFVTVGGRLCIYALFKGEERQPSSKNGSVSLKGECDGKPVQHQMTFSLEADAEPDKSAPVHRLAAKTQIKQLETEEAKVTESYYMGQTDTDYRNETRQNMILLSKSANVVSKMTAFIAVDKEAEKKVDGKMLKRSCPVPVATPELSAELMKRQHSNGVQERYRCLSTPIKRRTAPLRQACSYSVYTADALSRNDSQLSPKSANLSLQSANFYKTAKKKSLGGFSFGGFGIISKVKDMFSFGPVSSPKSAESVMIGDNSPEIGGRVSFSTEDSLLRLIDFQEIQGFWKMSSDVLKMIGVKENAINSVAGLKDVITTAAVLIWLRSKFSSRHDEWEMIEKKSLSWLGTKLNNGETIDELLQKVEKSLWPKGLV